MSPGRQEKAPMKRITLFAVLLAALAIGCSDDEAPTQPPPPQPGPPTILLTPSTATVLVRATQSFVATPSADSDSVVTWRLVRDPSISDTANVGTIVSTGPKSAIYTAPPSVVPLNNDYLINVKAMSKRDTTVYGIARVTVPRVKVTVVPNLVASVPPATQVPLQVVVQNAPTPGFSLFVNGIAGGDAGVGTWVENGPATTVYTAPVHDTLFTYALQAKSAEDPRHFGTAQVTVIPGFALPSTDNASDQFAPEWDPTSHRLAYVRGGTWDLVVYDFALQTERVLTRVNWSGPRYDGRIAWSNDGDKLLFSEETAGRRTIGLIGANGANRASFAPEALTDYVEACFLPTSPESIYVAEHKGIDWALRAYRLSGLPGERGRGIYTPAPTVEVHTPDAVMLPPNLRPFVGFEVVVNGDGTVRSLRDDGDGLVGVAYSSATSRTSQVRWVVQADGTTWLTFIYGLNHIVYRVDKSGLQLPQQCYMDYFPESATDLRADRPAFFRFVDAHAVARQMPGGRTQIWIMAFPPSDVLPVPPGGPRPQRAPGAFARALLGR
jgi:hypothetical protein